MVATLERVAFESGLPKTIRLDNGPEFVCKELDLWTFMRGVILDFSRPGRRTDNAYIVSTRRGKNARLGVENITTVVRIARSAAKRRGSFIPRPATPASRAGDEVGIFPV